MAALKGGYIPDRWREMRVVLIPKPGRELTQTKNWRPLNLNNCIGKLGEKVVADRIQEVGSSILHHQQYGSVRGRSAGDVLYKSVVRARESLKGGGSVGWAFWELKGGFQNVRSTEVLARMEGCTPLRCWLSWLKRFMSPREFEVAWDGGVRGRGAAATGVRQGSPLSPVLFLVFMALILEEMETRVKEKVGRVEVQFPSDVDDARVRYSTALPHLLLFIIFPISHVYYICYFLLSMYGHQGNAGTLSHVIPVNYRKR